MPLFVDDRDDRPLVQRFRQWLAHGERTTFRAVAMTVFFGLLAGLVVISVTASGVLVPVLAALLAGAMLKIIIPYQAYREWARSYYTGDAGDRWRERLHSAWTWMTRQANRLAVWR